MSTPTPQEYRTSAGTTNTPCCAGTGRGFTTRTGARGQLIIDRYHPCPTCRPVAYAAALLPRRITVITGGKK